MLYLIFAFFNFTNAEEVITYSFSSAVVGETCDIFNIGENGDFQNLTDALNSDRVGDGDKIIIPSGEYNIGNLVLNKSVILVSADFDNVAVLNGTLTIAPEKNVTIENLKISATELDNSIIVSENSTVNFIGYSELYGHPKSAGKINLNGDVSTWDKIIK